MASDPRTLSVLDESTDLGGLDFPPELDAILASRFCGSEQLGSKGFTEFMMSPSVGVALRTYFWPTENAKGVVLLVHGHGSYTVHEFLLSKGLGNPAAYEGSWVEQLNKAGFSVCGLDAVGHGLSAGIDGLRCFFRRFEDLSTDVTAFAKTLGDRGLPNFSGIPIFLLGCSMGGGLSVHAMATAPPDLFRGAVLLAPMLSLERVSKKGLNPYIRPLSSLLSWLTPALQVVATEKSPINEQVQLEWEEDPLTYSEPTRVRVAHEYIISTEALGKTFQQVTAPFLVFHSERDTMCDPDGSKRLYLQAQSKDKTLRLVNDMWHVLVKENENEHVLATIIDWLDERSGGGGEAPDAFSINGNGV